MTGGEDNQPQLEPGEPLEPLRFVYDLPLVSQRKLAIIKLVAKYTVIDPDQIAGHEFDFLNPKHSLHGLFQSFVKQYRFVHDGAQPLEGDVLRRAIKRAALPESGNTESTSIVNSAETTASDVDGNTQKHANGDLIDEQYASIDWQDFVVLETVEFFSADLNGTSNLSAPFAKEELELQKFSNSRGTASEPLFKSALTGEIIPASQYNEHIRVLMLDPSYHRQREKEKARQANSNLDTENVVENLARLREKRRRLLEDTR